MNGPSSVAAEYAVVAKTHVLQAERGDSPWSKCTSAWTYTVGSSRRVPSGRWCAAMGGPIPSDRQRARSVSGALCPDRGGGRGRSGPTWHFVDQLQDAVSRVVVVDAFRTRLKAGFAAKTDRLDARRLADALRRESVVGIYVPPPAIREWRELCRHRQTLVRTRRALVQRLRALLLRHGIIEAKRLTTPAGLATLDRYGLSGHAGDALVQLRGLILAIDEQLAGVDATVIADATGTASRRP